MLTFEGAQTQGTEAIVAKLSGLPFQTVKHQVSTRDCQPTGDGNSLVVTVTGQLIVDDGQQPLGFSQVSVAAAPPWQQQQRVHLHSILFSSLWHATLAQTFILNPDGSGSYYVFNDLFRLNYG